VKTVFVNRYCHPDHSATSQMLSELTSDLAAAGMQVHVVASRQLYDDPRADLASLEVAGGVVLHRVWTTRFGRSHLLGRAFDYLSFYFTAGLCLLRLLKRGDVVVAKTDPPLISVVAALAARIRGCHLINWFQDVFPEVAQRLEVAVARGIPLRIARDLRDRSARFATVNVVLGERMALELARISGCGSERIRVIHNWADGAVITPLEAGANPLVGEWGLAGKFVVGYSGNMGRAHEFETLLSAIELTRDEPDLVFLFVGGGKQTAWLKEEAVRRGLGNIVFQPYQPRAVLARSLGAADVHLVSLNPALEGLVVPSKFYGVAAAGRPTIFVGDPDGEVGQIVAANLCGYAIRIGDSEGLAQRIRSFKRDPSLRLRMGENARSVFCEKFDRPRGVSEWKSVLEIAGRGGGRI
jgi:colanic acid biosynthesis glycosyl transferase WcaI